MKNKISNICIYICKKIQMFLILVYKVILNANLLLNIKNQNYKPINDILIKRFLINIEN